MHLPLLNSPGGAAFKLHVPSQTDAIIVRPTGTVRLRALAPCVTTELGAVEQASSLRSTAWELVQEALDILAVRHRHCLFTYGGEHEYILWRKGAKGYTVTIGQTLDFRWSAHGTGTVHPPPSTAPAPPQPAVPTLPNATNLHQVHHPAFRFLRMSQGSEDLFDTYRNAYLALECLVSDASAKVVSENEPDWLERVLTGPLLPAIPGGIGVRQAIRQIYRHGRNPIFHAKVGESFQLPHGTERLAIQRALALLNLLLSSIVSHRFGSGYFSRWAQFSPSLVDGMARAAFEVDEIVFTSDLASESLRPIVRVRDTPRRFGNLWATIESKAPTSLDSLRGIKLRLSDQDRITFEIPERLPLPGIRTLRIELNHLEGNDRSPTALHPM